MPVSGEGLANLLTAISYFWISGLMVYLGLKSKLIRTLKNKSWNAGQRSPLLLTALSTALFVLFIFFCGLTHLVMPYSMYHENLRLVFLYICCAISVTTALAATFVFPALKAITDKLELTEEGMLQQVQSSLVEVIEACQESIVVMTGDWRIVSSNGCTKNFFGANCSSVNFLTLVHEEDKERLVKEINDALYHTRRKLTLECSDVEMGESGTQKAQHRVEFRVKDISDNWTWIESTLMVTCCSALLSAPQDGDFNSLWGVSFSDDDSLPSNVRLMMLSRNINDLKREERLRLEEENAKFKDQENSAKLNYITSCAHELKTPLQSFNYSLELLKNTPLTPDQLDILHQARVSSLMLSMTISQTMDTSKVMVGDKLIPRKGTMGLSEIISRVCIIIDSYSRQVPVSFNLGRGIHNSIITDKEWLWQMIVNYLTNACKYTESGSIEMNVKLWSDVSDKAIYGTPGDSATGDFLLFETVDTGIGISEKNMPTLFNMFGLAQTGQATGTGMGLYGIKVRAEGLGGSCGAIRRQSYDGQEGTVFWFKIPYLVDRRDPMGRKSSDDFLAEVSHFEKQKCLFLSMQMQNNSLRLCLRPESQMVALPCIGDYANTLCRQSTMEINASKSPEWEDRTSLDFPIPELSAFVVDDAPSIRKLLKRTLMAIGFKRIELFENGSKALAAMKEEVVDFVFMDIQMPVMSGPEAVARLRDFERDTGRTRRQLIIASSANFTSNDHMDMIAIDKFDAIIPKPVGVSDLTRVIAQYNAGDLPLKMGSK